MRRGLVDRQAFKGAQKMKHSRRVLLYSLILVIACIAAGIALLKRFQALRMSRVSVRTADVVPKFKPEEVEEIKITWRVLSTTIRKKNGGWVIAERGDLPADSSKIASFLEAVRTMHPLKIITPADRAVMSRLRVAAEEPDPKVVPGIRFVLRNGKSESLLDLVMGRGHFVNLPDDMTPREQRAPDGRYLSIAKPDGSSVVFLTPSVFEDFHPVTGTWLQSPVFRNIAYTIRMEFRQLPQKNPVWMIFRSGKTPNFTAFGPGNHVVSRQAVLTICRLLSRHYIADARLRSYYRELEPSFASFTAEDSSGVIRTLRFHRLKSDPRRILFTVESSLAKGKNVGKDARKATAEFTAGREDVCYEISAQVFELLKTPPFEQPKKQ